MRHTANWRLAHGKHTGPHSLRPRQEPPAQGPLLTLFPPSCLHTPLHGSVPTRMDGPCFVSPSAEVGVVRRGLPQSPAESWAQGQALKACGQMK